MNALEKHPNKDRIVEAMQQLIADIKLHGEMIKAGCSHLLDLYGR
jgi:hypothetical protein